MVWVLDSRKLTQLTCGGTGTGAAHVIARAAKELNILTVGVVTLPFLYEGPSRMRRAQQGLEELRKHVDTIIVIPNQNLFKIANEQTTFEDSFNLSNNVLMHGVQSITDLMVRPGHHHAVVDGRASSPHLPVPCTGRVPDVD